MKLPTVSMALAISLVTATAALSYATQSEAPVWDAARNDAIEACLGYELLHIRLSSAQGAESFRAEGRCVEVLMLKSTSSFELRGYEGDS